MCGITGYVGLENVQEALLHGLERLEYRGYDSAGIYVVPEAGQGVLTKAVGRIQALKDKVAPEVQASLGIGHTRWATHGPASELNAHPHQSVDGRFSLVHNGVIENYQQLKQDYLSDYPLQSDTDSEVIVALVDHFAVQEGLTTEEAFRKTLGILEGAYALGLVDLDDADRLYAAKNRSPLLVALGADFKGVVSDAMAALEYTDEFTEIEDGEMIVLTADEVQITDAQGQPVQRQSYRVTIDPHDLDKGSYPYYMLKEIDEQPAVIRKLIQAYQDTPGQPGIQPDLLDRLEASDRLYIIAAGTSYHAGLVGKNLLESWAGIPAEVCVASEFAYHRPLLSQRPYFIFISQSGETADSRQVLVQVKAEGYPTLTLTNMPGSTLAREADDVLYLHAGPEIAVASTKAYTAQVVVLAILAQHLAGAQGRSLDFDLATELGRLAQSIEAILADADQIKTLATEFLKGSQRAFYLGRGLDYYSSLEAALKLKEISYIQTEAYPAGELKHGPIALIEQGTPVIFFISQATTAALVRGNVEEVRARGAQISIVACGDCYQDGDAVQVMAIHPDLTPVPLVVVGQLIAYYETLERGYDIDKPRNLAKSVTVE